MLILRIKKTVFWGVEFMSKQTIKGTENVDELISKVFVHVKKVINSASINDFRHNKLRRQQKLLFF